MRDGCHVEKELSPSACGGEVALPCGIEVISTFYSPFCQDGGSMGAWKCGTGSVLELYFFPFSLCTLHSSTSMKDSLQKYKSVNSNEGMNIFIHVVLWVGWSKKAPTNFNQTRDRMAPRDDGMGGQRTAAVRLDAHGNVSMRGARAKL